MEVRKINLSSGIFLWWEIGESRQHPNYYIIQFRQNTTNPIIFFDHIIGSQIPIDEDNISQIQPSLNKIQIISNVTNLNASSSITITQVKLPGNVTGILIPNAPRLDVRVLGSLSEKFDVLQQDLRFIKWTTFDASQKHMASSVEFKLISAEARQIRIDLNINQINNQSKCLEICFKIKNDTFLKGTKCLNM